MFPVARSLLRVQSRGFWTDALVIAEAPDNVTAAALALITSASEMVSTSTTVLLTPEEMDAASKKTVSYRPLGK